MFSLTFSIAKINRVSYNNLKHALKFTIFSTHLKKINVWKENQTSIQRCFTCRTTFQQKNTEKAIVLNPNNVQWQVFADPTLSQTVRQNCVEVERLKSKTESLIQDINDWGFELANLKDSVETLNKFSLNYTSTSNDYKSDMDYFQEELSKMIMNVNYGNEITIAHDQEIDELKLKIEDALCLFKSLTRELSEMRSQFSNLLQPADIEIAVRDMRKELQDFNLTTNKRISDVQSQLDDLRTIIKGNFNVENNPKYE